jgi:tetratricopeptide (TPR) repeat protein
LLVAALAVSAPMSPSMAADEQGQVLASRLFDAARELMARGQYAEACPKLEESEQLGPAGGTLLNLALCYEKMGRLAGAWSAFHDALDVALREQRTERIEEARNRIKALEERVSRLTVVVPPGLAAVPGLIVRVDGTAVGQRAWGEPTFVDGGEHTVDASAPGREAWRQVLTLAPERDARTVEVPVLATTAVPVAPPPPPHRASILPAAVVGGAGLVALGIGTYFGVAAIQKRHDVENACPNLGACTTQGKATNDTALFDADASTVSLAIGAAAAAAGVILYLVESSSSTPSSSTQASLRGNSLVIRW